MIGFNLLHLQRTGPILESPHPKPGEYAKLTFSAVDRCLVKLLEIGVLAGASSASSLFG